MASKKNNPKVVATKTPTKKNTTTPTKTTAKPTKSNTVVKSASKKSTVAKSATTSLSVAESHIISKTKGAAMVSSFLNATDANPMPFTINKAYEFNKEIFDLIFSDVKVIGIRIYFAVNDLNELCLVFTGTDALKNDTYIPLDARMQSALNDIYGVADMGQACPPLYAGGKAVTQLP